MTTPVAYSLGASIAQSHIARCHRMNGSSKHTHTLNIGVLTLNICLAHEHLALHVHKRAHCGSGNTMLSGTCLGNDACLAHLLCHENLTDGVVYLVRTGMVEVLALEIKLAPVLLAHATGIVQGRGTTYIIAQE